MWIADRWNEYKVIDTADGEKLEDWGGYRLIRPDPQVLWNDAADRRLWKKPNAHYHRSSKGGGEWEFFDLPETWDIHYTLSDMVHSDSRSSYSCSKICDAAASGSQITFHLKPFAFKHTGVFPEQAVNWDWSYSLIRKRIAVLREKGEERPVKVLNLFAYTGGATMAAAKAGAEVVHVDASKGMVSWAKENAVSSGLKDAPIRWLVDDCGKFVEREIRRGNKYDAIIMDPPSYGRGPKGEIWKIEESIYPFVKLCTELLCDEPLFMLINSYTTGLQAGVLTYMLRLTAGSRFNGHTEASEIGLPVGAPEKEGSQPGLILPEGASGRFIGAAALK